MSFMGRHSKKICFGCEAGQSRRASSEESFASIAGAAPGCQAPKGPCRVPSDGRGAEEKWRKYRLCVIPPIEPRGESPSYAGAALASTRLKLEKLAGRRRLDDADQYAH